MRYKIIISSAAALIIGGFVAYAYFSPEKRVLKTHLTIYVEPPVLTEGGGVIVAGRRIPEAQWRALSEGYNPLVEDPNNPKKLDVKEGDRHFGAIVTSPASAVEFFYPENGSYTFNFRVLPKTEEQHPERLETKLNSFGSGGIRDPEIGEDVTWDSTNAIYIAGQKNDIAWSRLMASKFQTSSYRYSADEVKLQKFLGNRVLYLTETSMKKYIVDNK